MFKEINALQYIPLGPEFDLVAGSDAVHAVLAVQDDRYRRLMSRLWAVCVIVHRDLARESFAVSNAHTSQAACLLSWLDLNQHLNSEWEHSGCAEKSQNSIVCDTPADIELLYKQLMEESQNTDAVVIAVIFGLLHKSYVYACNWALR